MKFVFKAKTSQGDTREGIIEAGSVESATAELQKNGLFPTSLVPESENRDSLKKTILKYYERVTDKELVVFFKQMAILIEARVPIISSLTAIAEQSTNRYLQKVLTEIIRDIEDGLSLSESMAKHRDVFSNLSLNIIKAGETSGNLKKSIEYVAGNIERNYALNSRIRSALMYPSIVLTVFFIIGFIMVSFILPNLTKIIKEIQATIPWYTQVVISVGDFMSEYWWAVAVIIIAIVVSLFYYIKSPHGREEWDHVKIKLPIIGPLFRYIYIARFAENLAVLLAGGIPIIRALTTVSAVINNSVYERLIVRTADAVKMGGNMSDVLSRSPLFPPVVAHMIKIGEEAGQMEAVLNHISKFYDQETEMITKNLSTLIEPVLMVIIGIGVGFMAFAILMPIYNIAGQIQ